MNALTARAPLCARNSRRRHCPKHPAAQASRIRRALQSARRAAAKDKVKKAPSAYMLFCKKERPAIVKANPNATFGEVGKLLGAAWGKLSDASKAKYK